MADDMYRNPGGNKNDADDFSRLISSRPHRETRPQGMTSGGDSRFIERGDVPISKRPSAQPQYAPQRAVNPSRQAPQRSAQPAPQSRGSAQPQKPAKKRKKHHPVRNFILFLLVLIIAAGSLGAWAVVSVVKTISREPLDVEGALSGSGYSLSYATKNSRVTNVLLIGQDSDTIDYYSRSDTMLLLSIDERNKTVKLTSFLRDCYVEIPGWGRGRLNAANVYGGPSLLLATIAYNFNVRVDHYALVGYYALGLIVDDLGGVTLPELTDTESRMLAEAEIYLDPGTNVKLNGWQALMYCRIRHLETDFERTARQRKMFSLLMHKLRSSMPTDVYKAAKDAAYQCETDMTVREMLLLAAKAVPCLLSDFESLQIPADGTWSYGNKQGQDVILIDEAANAEALRTHIYG
ncbi:MAG: LCP family protein [Clostridia bacterium]|nr:LCP family protein [Clostridia bacterium]